MTICRSCTSSSSCITDKSSSLMYSISCFSCAKVSGAALDKSDLISGFTSADGRVRSVANRRLQTLFYRELASRKLKGFRSVRNRLRSRFFTEHGITENMVSHREGQRGGQGRGCHLRCFRVLLQIEDRREDQSYLVPVLL